MELQRYRNLAFSLIYQNSKDGSCDISGYKALQGSSSILGYVLRVKWNYETFDTVWLFLHLWNDTDGWWYVSS